MNGAVKQDGNTKDMLFSIPRLIQHISTIMTLEVGDHLLRSILGSADLESGLRRETSFSRARRLVLARSVLATRWSAH